ncbi:MAG: gamma carbonic anhydrase family protein [Deltaproteobacteria bacterium]|nr:gamma carbonic anhydrase family protein [Deltaproteobacteria bacterium]
MPVELPHLAKSPRIHPSVHVDPTARILGDVTIDEDASVWCNVTIRGDVHSIHIGPRSNIQDNCVLHCTFEKHPLKIGPEVVVGHGVILHGCTIKGPALIGMGAILMDACVIEEDVLVGAGALVTEGRVMPRGHLVVGSPAKAVRPLTLDEMALVRGQWESYLGYVRAYREQGRFRGWDTHPLKD